MANECGGVCRHRLLQSKGKQDLRGDPEVEGKRQLPP